METRQFTILPVNKNTVESQLEKLNKRAIKIGLSPITWAFGKPIINNKGQLTLPIEISGPIYVHYDNWEFSATLQHLPTGENIVRVISEEDLLPAQYRNCSSNCEHCKVNRYRKDTYVVKNVVTNVYMQVGSTCIKDFLGQDSPDNILLKANLASEIISFIRNNEFLGSNSEPYDIISHFLAQTSACISIHGWVSKSKAYESGKVSTVSRIQDSLVGDSNPIKISPADIAKANMAIEWVESLSDQEVEESDYLYNIRAIVRSGIVEWRTMGFAASIISAFDRHQDSKKTKIISNHVGTIKSREVFNLTLKNKFEYMGSYGTTYKYIFNDDFGNVIIWNASNCQDFIINRKYSLRGTIKKHSEFKNVKQTEINRCELLCELTE